MDESLSNDNNVENAKVMIRATRDWANGDGIPKDTLSQVNQMDAMVRLREQAKVEALVSIADTMLDIHAMLSEISDSLRRD